MSSDEKFRENLSEEAFRVTREGGTEPAHSGEYADHDEEGTYRCVCCGTPLFDSGAKFHSGTGWPSFWEPIDGDEIQETPDYSTGTERTEVCCRSCDAHLGHVFEDGPEPTGLRYCINSAALDFEEDDGG